MFNIHKILILLIVSTLLATSDIVTFRHLSLQPEHGPDLYGFPFAFRSAVPQVKPVAADIYLKGLSMNIAFWFLMSSLLSMVISRNISMRELELPLLSLRTAIIVFAFIVLTSQSILISWSYLWDLPWDPGNYSKEFLFIQYLR